MSNTNEVSDVMTRCNLSEDEFDYLYSQLKQDIGEYGTYSIEEVMKLIVNELNNE